MSFYVLDGELLSAKQQRLLKPVPLIIEMHYSTELRSMGWSNMDVEAHDRLMLQHNIGVEDVLGVDSLVPNFHIGTHVGRDVVRHSSTDNYWCFAQERLVSASVNTATNRKHMENTYARKQCLKVYNLARRLTSTYENGFVSTNVGPGTICRDLCLQSSKPRALAAMWKAQHYLTAAEISCQM